MKEFDLESRFNSCCFQLERNDILELNEKDTGPINNVIAGVDRHCYGISLSEYEHGLLVEMFYINGGKELKGDIIQIDLKDRYYFELLMRFCVMLVNDYNDVDAIAAFNTFQKKLRSGLEKLGFLTITDRELRPFKGKNAVMMSSSSKGIFKVDFIDHKEFYRDFFANIVDQELILGSEYVYLMVNVDSCCIKIGRSKKPFYREKTLQSQEPDVHLIALWQGNRVLEKELHRMFNQKKVRGEWFRLSISDLLDIEKFMADKTMGTIK